MTTGCVTGFNIYDVTSGNTVLLGTVPNGSNPSGQQIVTSILTLDNPTIGTHTIYARAAYVGSNGVHAESTNSPTATFTVNAAAPNAPLAVTVKAK